MKKRNKTPEKLLCKQICFSIELAKMQGSLKDCFLYFHIPNEVRAAKSKSEEIRNINYIRALKEIGFKTGAPDYVFIFQGGHSIFIEVKACPKSKLSPMQEEFKKACDKYNISYYKISSVEEIMSILHNKINSLSE